MSEPGLTAKIVSLHTELDAAGLPHAFGGALALAFCVSNPRTTKDIDLNVFIAPSEIARLERGLPEGVGVTVPDRVRIERDGQSRLWWGRTPVDVFLSNHSFHQHVAASRRLVPFAGVQLPVLACADLAVFKAFFARPKDAIDIATMASAGAIDVDRIEATVSALLADEDRTDFFTDVRKALRR